jgi:hypothetical protein
LFCFFSKKIFIWFYDNIFVKKFREWFIDFSDGLDICSEVWDYFKEYIKTFCTKYCKEKNKVKYKASRDLRKKRVHYNNFLLVV